MGLVRGLAGTARSMVVLVMVFAISVVPTVALAESPVFGAKVSIDSGGAVEVNNIRVYDPERNLYAESGQIMTDAGDQEDLEDLEGEDDEKSWYTPTWGKFAIGLIGVGVGVGAYFIIDNNIDDDDDDDDGYWYYDPDCDCYKWHD